jgi:hypothetical protein
MLILPSDRYGLDFIPPEFLPPGKDEYWLRNAQQEEMLPPEQRNWRHLEKREIEALESNGNLCPDWKRVLVRDPFDPSLVRNSCFYGLVRIGIVRNVLLKHHDFCVPAGIRGSTIISCDIGDDCAVQDCSYISHYIIGSKCILSRIDEMQTTNHAKFGNGAIKDGEEEDVRVWIDVMNEAGGRSILPFDGMIPADAFLWASYREDAPLLENLKNMTQKKYGRLRGTYGVIGSGSVVKSCAIIKDTLVGEYAYIKGANKLKNITINSSADEPSQIGEGVEMVNGIAGYGCHIFYGSKAVRFVIGRNCNLKYGARLIHSVLGDNSTVSCCEILNNLIFPVHEQHHNNSFLIASLVQGMSNMAAAATIGSNHNSRANDGEIRAKRGFWPALAVSLKHSSCFASFVIIAKGEYPAELNIPLPFSLVNNNVHKNRLEVLPAYYWIHNLYALERNSWKSQNRDRRVHRQQYIETAYLAPDTAEEIIGALSLLSGWLEESGFSPYDMSGSLETAPPESRENSDEKRVIPCRQMERSKRDQVIVNPLRAIAAYRQMLRYYAVKTLASFFDLAFAENPGAAFAELCAALSCAEGENRVSCWVNMGGQIVPSFRVDALRQEIGEGKITEWDAVHRVYDQWQQEYPLDRARHAFAVLALMNDGMPLDSALFKKELAFALETRRWITSQIYETREKDFQNPFKKATFRNHLEMERVLGTAASNSFVLLAREEEKNFAQMTARLDARL